MAGLHDLKRSHCNRVWDLAAEILRFAQNDNGGKAQNATPFLSLRGAERRSNLVVGQGVVISGRLYIGCGGI